MCISSNTDNSSRNPLCVFPAIICYLLSRDQSRIFEKVQYCKNKKKNLYLVGGGSSSSSSFCSESVQKQRKIENQVILFAAKKKSFQGEERKVKFCSRGSSHVPTQHMPCAFFPIELHSQYLQLALFVGSSYMALLSCTYTRTYHTRVSAGTVRRNSSGKNILKRD